MRGIAIEPTYFDLENEDVDVSKVVALARKLHADTLRVGVFSHNGYAYYQSAIAPHAPGLGKRDLLSEFKKESGECGLHLMVYTNATATTLMQGEHPDWVSCINGKPKVWDVYPIAFMCPNSPYHAYYKSIVGEIVRKYGPETMYIDCAQLFLLCQCRYCREAFERSCGGELPAGPDWDNPQWHRYREWLKKANRQLWRDVAETIRQMRPGTGVIFNRGSFRNWLVSPPEESAAFAHGIGDGIHVESAVRFYNQSFSHVDEQCMFGRAIGTRPWVWIEYPVMPWSHLSCPPAEIKIKAAKVMAHGANPMVWSVPRAPDCDEKGLPAVGEMYGLMEQNDEYLSRSAPVTFAAVLSSTQTGEWYVREIEPDWDQEMTERAMRFEHNFQGMLKTLSRNHIPAGIVLDGQLTPEYLSRYKVLILPNSACLSDEQCEGISAFVKHGGGLIATHESSLYDEKGSKRQDFGLSKLLGCRFVRHLGEQSSGFQIAGYMKLEADHPVTGCFPSGFKFPVGGEYIGVETGDGRRAIATLLAPTRYYCDYYGKKTGYPGLVVNQSGDGRVVYIPGELGRMYCERGFVEYKKLMHNAVMWVAGGDLPLETDLPETVEVSLTELDDGATMVCHVINCTADTGCPVEEVVPVSGAVLKVRLPEGRHVERVFLLRSKHELACRTEGRHAVIELPTLHEYEGVVIQSQP